MVKKRMAQKRKRLILRTVLQIIIPLAIAGFLLGLTMSGDIKQALLGFVNFLMLGLIFGFSNNIDRLLSHYGFKRLAFNKLQFIKILLETIIVFAVITTYYYIKNEAFILNTKNIDTLLIILVFSWTISFVIRLTLILRRMVGHEVIMKYLSGKYHNPIEEERIFMFIDLQSSTTIAERIGHKQFFSLINELFYEIGDIIIENEGEIYKYVGDEVIVTWTLKRGLRRSQCIKVFFEIEQKILYSKENYLTKYGVIPQFRAGVHVGKVIVGEMGDLKSEIAYMGDAVNTASRIQTECKKQNSRLLISKELLTLLPPDTSYHFEELDQVRLKGKLTDTTLVRVTMPHPEM